MNEDRIIESFRTWEIEKITAWFLLAFRENTVQELPFTAEPSLERQIQNVYFLADENVRIKLKSALISAVNEWQYPVHGAATIVGLSLVSAYIRARSTMLPIAEIVYKQKVGQFSEYTDYYEKLLAVLVGFATIHTDRYVLEKIFFWEDLDPKFASILFIGLAKINPEDLPLYLDRFLLQRSVVPHFFRDDFIVWNLLQEVGISTIGRVFPSLQEASFDYIIRNSISSMLPIKMNTYWEALSLEGKYKFIACFRTHYGEESITVHETDNKLVVKIPGCVEDTSIPNKGEDFGLAITGQFKYAVPLLRAGLVDDMDKPE